MFDKDNVQFKELKTDLFLHVEIKRNVLLNITPASTEEVQILITIYQQKNCLFCVKIEEIF